MALVARLRAGDAAAFDDVIGRFHAPLFNFLARLSRRRDLAEDLLEETWLRLVARAPALREDTRLGPWLFTVARNLYASYCRSRLVEDSHVASLIGLWPCGTPQPSPFESAAATESERRIEAALAALPVLAREALLLVGVQGLSITEASEACGISPEAMRQRISRARALLTRRLDDVAAPRLTGLREVET
ncbi:MAG: RNA polymerase sigma factor [Acidobacteria bacterium]|nr:RNA polymerase sigma factor [Acidobacteriota bacterium]